MNIRVELAVELAEWERLDARGDHAAAVQAEQVSARLRRLHAALARAEREAGDHRDELANQVVAR